MTYLLDANVFIEAKNRYYGFDLCPAFWAWLAEANATGRVASVEKVGQELRDRKDELSDWAKEQGSDFFLPPDEDVLRSLVAATQWATGKLDDPYRQSAINEFAGSADLYLVAHAHAHGLTVVTHEVAAPDAKKEIKIPDVCEALRIPCMNPFAMLKAEGPVFVLETPSEREAES